MITNEVPRNLSYIPSILIGFITGWHIHGNNYPQVLGLGLAFVLMWAIAIEFIIGDVYES